MRRSIIRTMTCLFFTAAISHVAAADQLETIKSKGVIECGVNGTTPIFSFRDQESRKTIGYDVDICEALANKLGVKAELKLVAPLARIPELNQGRFDVIISTLGWTAERATQVDYSHVYVNSNQLIGARKDSGVTSLADLKGKRIAAQSASTSASAARAKVPDAQLVTFDSGSQSFLALQQKKAVAIALSELMLQSYANETKGKEGEIVLLRDEPLMVEYSGVGVRKGETALLEAINAALLDLEASGEIDRIFDKWVGKDSEFGLKRTFKVGPVPGSV